MKSNQFAKDNQAQVGIGTMIVFIATILVAAIAAGVLIETSHKLQAKSTRTGNEATQQVASSLQIVTVYGKRDATSGDLARIEVWVQLSSGSDPVDLDELIIQVKTPTKVNLTEYEDNVLTAYAGSLQGEFKVFDDDGTTASTDRVVQPGERHMILVGRDSASAGNSLALGVKTKVQVDLIPAAGVPTGAGFTTPHTYDDEKVFELF